MSDAAKQAKSETALREEAVLAYWKERSIFEKSLAKDSPEGEFVFYDGPPFATGLPHSGHLLISAYKDAIGRYKTMRGYHVPRRWGWDCHGLPIENIVEKKLGLATKKDIEDMGVAKFNEEARNSVLTYVSDWKRYIERIGRWVDFDHSYKTMDNTYIESVWWALKKIHEDGRLYEGRKVLMFCPHCETPLSKAEIAMDNSYKDVTEKAVFVKFRVVGASLFGSGPISILAWTTTPWTLPANVALAVGSGITYVLVEHNGERLVLAKERISVLGEGVKVLKEMTGDALVGIAYEPLYDVVKAKAAGSSAAWTIVPADFVTTDDGTGIVHIAPMYGEDDYNLGVVHGLPVVPLLDATGTYNADAPELVRGMFYKKGGKYVIEDLESRGLLFGAHEHTHSYPHCYRCGTALIYNAITSWFINIQSVKERMLDANEQVAWYPEHLKHGRFKHIVETAPDWTISRNRYWASPLPIWRNETTGALTVIGSLAELRTHTRRSGNTYLFVRHGQAESNIKHIVSCSEDLPHHLTDEGKRQVLRAAKALKEKKVTKLVVSPLVRTRETAELLARELGISPADTVIEPRFKEWQLGNLSGRPVSEIQARCPTLHDRFTQACGDGAETLEEMKRRIGDALYEYEQTYRNETILIVAHEYTAWLAECVARGADIDRCIEIRGTNEDYIANGEVRELDFVPIPHNARYELDLHRPYIDDVSLLAPDGARLVRIPEVVDCWVESGAMPFASEHFPHENEDVVKRRYPGDFIAEYIAQTRTWFYYMHALGVLLFDAPSFKNCIATGTVLAADGSKMSKSKGNFTDPLENIDRYGADALRLYLLGSVLMAAEDVSFKDEELRESHNRFINMLWNSFKFYELYASHDNARDADVASDHILDRWVLARLDETIRDVTVHMDAYDTIRSARVLRDFVADLSQWYVRRSRERFKGDDVHDRAAALATTRRVLHTLARLIAPLTPYIAESVYSGTGGEGESVHLAPWPENAQDNAAATCIEDMAEVRRLASLALEVRQRTGIKVRQPLASVTCKSTILAGKGDYERILADELNVKEVRFDSKGEDEVVFDTVLTSALVTEGNTRELVRSVQDLRKKAGLTPEERITLAVATDAVGMEAVEAARAELERVAGVHDIVTGTGDEAAKVAVGDTVLHIELHPTPRA